MTEAERQSAAAVLGDRVPRLVDAWSSVCADKKFDRDDAEMVVRAVIGALVSPMDPGPLVDRVIGSGTPLDQCVHRLGLLRHVLYDEALATVPPGAAGDIAHAVDSAIDAVLETTVARMASDLAEAALIDPLTGMPNRRALEQDMAPDLANADRSGQELTVVMVDLDGLKQRNDSDGHAAGDAALRALAGALQAGLRAGDGAYRLGGDEFVLVLPGAAAGDADLVMARVRDSRPPAFSWGAASFPREGRDAAALLALADKRLYAGRRQRRHGGGASPAAAASADAGAAGPALRRRRSRSRSRRRGVRMAALCIRLASFAVPAAALAVLATTHRPGGHSPPAALAPAPSGPGQGTGTGAAAGGGSGPSTVRSVPPVGPPPSPAPSTAPSMTMPPVHLAAAHPAGTGPAPVTAPPAASAPPPSPPPSPQPVGPPVGGPPPVPAPTPPPTPRPECQEQDHRREHRQGESRRGEDCHRDGPSGAPYRQVERGP